MLVKLDDYVELRQGLAINAQSNHLLSNNQSNEFKYPLLKIVDMVNKKFNTFISKQVNKNVVAEKDDIIYTRTGQIGLAFRGFHGVVHNNSFIVTIKNNLLDKDFLFVLLNSDFVRKQALTMAKNSVQPDLTHSMFKSIKIPLYDIDTQRKIAKIVLSIENKIKQNNMMVKKLQVLAHSIYSSWFIQFNFPNKEGKAYKSSGGKMVYNDEIKREIPEGWEVKKLKDLMFRINRPFDYYNNEKTIDLSVMPSNSFCLANVNSSKSFSTNLFSMKKGDLLFGSIRPYLKKAGLAPCDGAVAGTVHCLNVYNEFDYNFCLLTLCSENMFNYANKASKGTKMPVISCDDLLEYPIVYNKEIIQKFQILNLKEFIPHLIDEIHKLTSLKNILLPILINGQLQ